MNLMNMLIPKPTEYKDNEGLVCQLSKLNWIEADPVHRPAVEQILAAMKQINAGHIAYYPGKMNIGNRQRISLLTDPDSTPESYVLEIGNESIVIRGGDRAGVFYGAQSLCQIMLLSAELGGHDRYVPAGIIKDAPRFAYRGIMLDSARHFQKKEVILRLLDQMARYKYNRLHWHLTDRQSWRIQLDCAPELAQNVPRSRAYTFGTYSKKDIEEIRSYAEDRAIVIVPEIEMPGHSAAVFMTHPELACPVSPTPYEDDFWEYCIGNPAVPEFLARILKEVAELFPNSPMIHIGGDEASTSKWEKCPVCLAKMKEMNFSSPRELEEHFMSEMESVVNSLGLHAVTWGTREAAGENFSPSMVIQNWLREDITPYLKAGHRVINSYHSSVYFDYPYDIGEPVEKWKKLAYEFDPAGALPEDLQKMVLGGEGCIWTEQIPEWRLLGRAVPRLRALSEALWSAPDKKDYENYRIRETRLLECSPHPET